MSKSTPRQLLLLGYCAPPPCWCTHSFDMPVRAPPVPYPPVYDCERLVGALTQLDRTTIPVLAGHTPGVRTVHNSLWGPPRYGPTDHTEERELLHAYYFKCPPQQGRTVLIDGYEDHSQWPTSSVTFVTQYMGSFRPSICRDSNPLASDRHARASWVKERVYPTVV
jgi:hypothetical protein